MRDCNAHMRGGYDEESEPAPAAAPHVCAHKRATRTSTLELALASVDVSRDELLRGLIAGGRNALDKGDELFRVRALVKEEVETVLQLDDVDRIGVRLVTQDELLHPKERPFVRNLLPQLHQGIPRVLGLATLAVGALLVADDVLNNERLLQHRSSDHLLLDGHTQLDALRVGLRPDEVGVGEADSSETARLAQE